MKCSFKPLQYSPDQFSVRESSFTALDIKYGTHQMEQKSIFYNYSTKQQMRFQLVKLHDHNENFTCKKRGMVALNEVSKHLL